MPGNGLEPGLYFGLPDEVYHADPALSRTDLVNLNDTPNTYWINSWMNGERKKRKSSDAMEYGSAFDCLMFEPALFEKRYQVVPIDAWAEHKEKISYEDYFKIIESIKVLRGGKDSRLFLSGGIPQVAVVFDHEGVRYRTRHDYFTPVLSTDFKTTYSLHPRHLQRAFDQYGYDIQLALYRWSRARFKEQYRAGEAHVYGACPRGFFDRFMADANNGFIFVFQRSTPPHPFLPIMPEDDTEEEGQKKIAKGVEIYLKNMQQHGIKEWPVCEGKVKAFSMFYGVRDNA